MSSLHDQGLYPSIFRLKKVLEKPCILRLPEINHIRKATLHEMGLTRELEAKFAPSTLLESKVYPLKDKLWVKLHSSLSRTTKR